MILNANVKHSGIYQCFASNNLGTVYASMLVIIRMDNNSFTSDYDDIDDEDDDDYDGKNKTFFFNLVFSMHNFTIHVLCNNTKILYIILTFLCIKNGGKTRITIAF